MLGPGIRGDLNSRFKGIQESVGLITSLPYSDVERRQNLDEGNARLLKAFRTFLAGAGLSDKMTRKHVENMTRVAIDMALDEPPRPLWSLNLSTGRSFIATNPAAATSVKRFARFLFETGRGDQSSVYDLQDIRQR